MGAVCLLMATAVVGRELTGHLECIVFYAERFRAQGRLDKIRHRWVVASSTGRLLKLLMNRAAVKSYGSRGQEQAWKCHVAIFIGLPVSRKPLEAGALVNAFC